MKKVAIIVLNYRGAQDTIECLQSLWHLAYPSFYIFVVDNDSGDGSVERIQAAITDPMRSFPADGENYLKSSDLQISCRCV